MKVYKFLDARFGLKSLSEKRLKISTLSDLNDPFELLPYELSNPMHRTVMRLTLTQMTARFGLLCFSSNWRDPVIWAHYGDKHRGLCLGFESPDVKCKEVKYISERVAFPTSPTQADSDRMLFTKYANWKYEREIRIWAELNERQGDLYFAEFGDELRLIKVIAGARCELSEREIVKALGALAKDVVLIKARAGFKQFEIVKDKRGFTKQI